MAGLLAEFPSIGFEELVAGVLLAYRVCPHVATGESPAFLLTGEDLKLPHEDIPDPRFQITSDRINLLRKLREEVKLRLQKVATRRTLKMSMKVRVAPTPRVGDLVVVRNRQYVPRFEAQWTLPKRVLSVSGDGKRLKVRDLLTNQESELSSKDIKIWEVDDRQIVKEAIRKEQSLDVYLNEEVLDVEDTSFLRTMPLEEPPDREGKRRRKVRKYAAEGKENDTGNAPLHTVSRNLSET
eukprot:GHVO01014339.1.p1 GENE.GHVO01014339.1~~GHVO01014339.1.p1  ORF type:complete len:239 (+),score=24.38 GHVO01014339.1:638-1354(+)